jgi:hypothetical protein
MKQLKKATKVLSQAHIGTLLDKETVVDTLCKSVSIILMAHLAEGEFVSNSDDTTIITTILPIVVKKFLLEKGRRKSIKHTFVKSKETKQKDLSLYYGQIIQRANSVLEEAKLATITYNPKTYTVTFALL